MLTSQVSSQGSGLGSYIAIPECEILTGFKPKFANKRGLQLNWNEHAQPANKLWVKSYRQFSSDPKGGFQKYDILTTATMVPTGKRINPWALHLRIELTEKVGKSINNEWPHLAFNFINHPSGKMQTLLLRYERRCQNTFLTRQPKIAISDVYVYEV